MLKDINEIRRVNAAKIVDERFGGDFHPLAEQLGTQPSFIGRLVRANASGKRNIGDGLARRLEQIGEKPPNWLDHDHERLSDEMGALLERYQRSDPDTQAMILLALDDPSAPIPDSMRPSLKLMIQAVRMTVAQHVSA